MESNFSSVENIFKLNDDPNNCDLENIEKINSEMTVNFISKKNGSFGSNESLYNFSFSINRIKFCEISLFIKPEELSLIRDFILHIEKKWLNKNETSFFHMNKYSKWKIRVTKELAVLESTCIVSKLCMSPELCLNLLNLIVSH